MIKNYYLVQYISRRYELTYREAWELLKSLLEEDIESLPTDVYLKLINSGIIDIVEDEQSKECSDFSAFKYKVCPGIAKLCRETNYLYRR